MRDVRRKRPPVLSFLLRLETLRRIARVVSLLVLDYIGVAAALTTAHRGEARRARATRASRAPGQTRTAGLAFAYLVTVLMFARVDLYADRPRRPGLGKIVSALFLATVIALVFALASGQQFSQLLHLLRLAVVRHRLHRGAARAAHAASPAGCSRRPATAAAR